MNKVTRTALELTKSEKLFNELIAEGRDVEKLGIVSHEFEEAAEESIRNSYEAWKLGEEPAFQSAYDLWVANGENTPALDEINSDLVS